MNKIMSMALYPHYQWVCDECLEKLAQIIEYDYLDWEPEGICDMCEKKEVG
jgi:hypothetical protein